MRIGNRRHLGRQGGIGRGQRAGSQSAASANAGAAPGAGNKQGAKKKFRPKKVLGELATDEVLTGKDLTRAARALTARELRPQLHGFSLLAKQLTEDRESSAKGLGALGTRLTGEVSDVYRNIASSEADNIARQQALANQLNQTSAQIAQQGQEGLASMQQGQMAEVTKGLEIRGAPGGGQAQQELASAVAAQQASQSANSQAAQQFAASQGAGYAGLAAAMAGTAQMQGGAAVGGIGRDVTNRIAESNRKFDEGIQTARAKLADVKATKGSLFAKNLLGLREGEQDFALGQAAVRGDKAKLRLEQQEAGEAKRQRQLENKRWEREFGLKQWEAHNPDASDDERKEKRQEIREDVRNIRSVIPTAVAAAKGSPEADNFEAYVSYVNTKTDAPPALVRKVLKRWWKRRRHAETQGNRGMPGATKVPHAP